ncbi:hypothetical protein EJB05_52069 [Eragrostis curvula]|uniref:Uncharacterized protein n=1 Tax=Eragrostis curvula TaxID=38414 RepID=A0A5J9SU43_9POAL|nr:hypothetical protein EJB05_52069 [Eragrostis curvula]
MRTLLAALSQRQRRRRRLPVRPRLRRQLGRFAAGRWRTLGRVRNQEPEARHRNNNGDDDDDNPDNAAVNSDASDAEPPRIAYLLEGTKGDGLRMRRTLQAIYHPRNQYILHLDLEAPPRERIDLAMYVKGDPMFSQVGNVRVIAKGNLVTYKGPTMVACTLHAVAILLKEGLEWDWFINLSASDYPLMTQDDILHVFSSLPRNLNFVEHFQLSGWKV